MTERVSNWRQALAAAELDELEHLLRVIANHRRQTGEEISAIQLRLILQARGVYFVRKSAAVGLRVPEEVPELH